MFDSNLQRKLDRLHDIASSLTDHTDSLVYNGRELQDAMDGLNDVDDEREVSTCRYCGVNRNVYVTLEDVQRRLADADRDAQSALNYMIGTVVDMETDLQDFDAQLYKLIEARRAIGEFALPD